MQTQDDVARWYRVSEAAKAKRNNPTYPRWVCEASDLLFNMLYPIGRIDRQRQHPSFYDGLVVGHHYSHHIMMRDAMPKEREQRTKNATSLVQNAFARISKEPLSIQHEFLRGFSMSLKRFASLDHECVPGATDRLDVLVCLLENKDKVQNLKTVTELHDLLTAQLGSNRVGHLRRVQKLCEEIHLQFRPPGRPRKN